MSYTQSMDASVRVKKNGMGNYYRHIYRDLYPDSNHSNENIDPNLTKNNISLVYDDEKGMLIRAKSPDDLNKVTSDIKEYSKTNTIRSDAVYLRPLIFQLGSGFYDDNPKGIDDKYKEFDLMYEWACSVWGKERIRGMSIHVDEVHDHEGHEGEVTPHMVLLVSPVKHDGDSVTMSQKNIINGNKHLKMLHGQLRQFMVEHGIDVQIENLETSALHRKDKEYKEFKDKQRSLKKWEAQLKQKEKDNMFIRGMIDAEKSDFENTKETYRAELQQEFEAYKETYREELQQKFETYKKTYRAEQDELLQQSRSELENARKQLDQLTEQHQANYDNAMAKVETREQEVTKREQEVADREPKVSQREQEVTNRELEVSQREKKLEDDTNALLKDNDRLEDALAEAEGMIPHIQAQMERERKQRQVERMRNVHEELEHKYRADIEDASDLLKGHTVTRDDVSMSN